ncbi:MAG TPA: class I SAM-dependent methyltransferase [Chthoniobacterales bacterium]|nr:class I SAM-dependent methyltransferase [Chthoniobacterales bacterium]
MDVSQINQPLPITPLIRGHIDVFEPAAGNQARLRGWVFRPDTAIERVEVGLGGHPWVSPFPLQERPDVQAAYENSLGPLPHLLSSGFDIAAPLPPEISANSNPIITLTPYDSKGERLDPLHTYFFDLQTELARSPQPPLDLQERVGGSKDFLHVAAQLANLLLTCIGKYRPLWEPGDILDWGCGCGRVINQLMKLIVPGRIHGCDIDVAAIKWDQAHLSGPTFSRIDPYPPTSYPDGKFDVIYGISVMTHLDEEAQLVWLAELQRIARPGAILALSVIGEELRKTNMPAELSAEYDAKGFATFVPNYSEMLAPFSHQGYYKETYHSLDYIRETWGKFFEVLECVETKHQDIILLRRIER